MKNTEEKINLSNIETTLIYDWVENIKEDMNFNHTIQLKKFYNEKIYPFEDKSLFTRVGKVVKELNSRKTSLSKVKRATLVYTLFAFRYHDKRTGKLCEVNRSNQDIIVTHINTDSLNEYLVYTIEDLYSELNKRIPDLSFYKTVELLEFLQSCNISMSKIEQRFNQSHLNKEVYWLLNDSKSIVNIKSLKKELSLRENLYNTRSKRKRLRQVCSQKGLSISEAKSFIERSCRH